MEDTDRRLRYMFARLVNSRLVLTHCTQDAAVDEFRGILSQVTRETEGDRAVASFIANLSKTNAVLARSMFSVPVLKHYALLGSGYQLAETLGLLGVARIVYNPQRACFDVFVTNHSTHQQQPLAVRKTRRYPDGTKAAEKMRGDNDIEAPRDPVVVVKRNTSAISAEECRGILDAALAQHLPQAPQDVKEWGDLV